MKYVILYSNDDGKNWYVYEDKNGVYTKSEAVDHCRTLAKHADDGVRLGYAQITNGVELVLVEAPFKESPIKL